MKTASRNLILLALAMHGTVGSASEMSEACSRYTDRDAVIDCYRTLIAVMQGNRSWCPTYGTKEIFELRASMDRSKDRIQASWAEERQRLTEEFRKLAEDHAVTLRATPNPTARARLAAIWYQIETEFRRRRQERESKKSLKGLYDDFADLDRMTGNLGCP